MPTLLRNIELKTRYADLDEARRVLASLHAAPCGRQRQTDTYFRVPNGRLKLREIVGKEPTLIWYDRPDGSEFRASSYRLVRVADPAALEHALEAACGVRGRVAKLREIYLLQNIRIHLDTVDGLGSFIEFEAVISPAHGEEISHKRLERLYSALAITADQHCSQSYADMMGI